MVETMICLARANRAHRVIVGGQDGPDLFIELYRRGYARLTTTGSCRIPCGQFDVALMAGRRQSARELAAALGRFVHFLDAAGVLAVGLETADGAASEQLRRTLDLLGFRIEAGSRCGDGVVVAARRLSIQPARQRHVVYVTSGGPPVAQAGALKQRA